MAIHIDATQQACPIPFMMAKRHIDETGEDFSILVDNRPAVENLKRLARTCNYSTTVTEEADRFTVQFTQSSDETPAVEAAPEKPTQTTHNRVIIIAHDGFGSGATELGRNLIRMFLYTLDQQQSLPTSIILLNSGVRLATEDQQAITSLQNLVHAGVQLLVCGTCLDYYGLLDKLSVGSVCTMYDIADRVMHADAVVSL